MLETIDESRVTRVNGLIETIDGMPVKDYLAGAVRKSANFMIEAVENNQLSKADLGTKRGAVNSVVLDRRTGDLAEGINGRRGAAEIPLDELHPVLKERLEKMEEQGPYQQWKQPRDSSAPPEPAGLTPYPHPDEPLRHAEVKAVNELLWNREKKGLRVEQGTLQDFHIDNLFTLKEEPDGGPTPAPCCANCSRMVDGAAVTPGRLPYAPGHPDFEVTR